MTGLDLGSVNPEYKLIFLKKKKRAQPHYHTPLIKTCTEALRPLPHHTCSVTHLLSVETPTPMEDT